jgi:hypothetical protein
MAEHRSADTPNVWIPSPAVRKYLYRLFMALGPVLAAHGVLTGADWALWSGLAATVLDVPLALAQANVPRGGGSA